MSTIDRIPRAGLADDWHADHDNLVLLVQWAEGEGYSAAEIVRMIEKPWKWKAEFIIASCRATDTRKAKR